MRNFFVTGGSFLGSNLVLSLLKGGNKFQYLTIFLEAMPEDYQKFQKKLIFLTVM